MTITLITETYLPTTNSIVNHIELLRTQLQQLGHEVQILAPEPRGVRVQSDVVHYLPSVPLPGNAGYHLSFPNLANAEPIINRSDVVHSHHPFTLGSWGQRVAKRAGKPFIFTNHAHYLSFDNHTAGFGSLKKRPVASFITQFAQASTAVVAPTSAIASNLTSPALTRPIRVIANGIDTTRFGRGNGTQWRSTLSIPANHLLALTVGQLTGAANIPLILGALTRLGETYKLVVVGDGPQRPALEAQTTTLGLADRVFFLGQIGYRSMPDLYAGADVLVNGATDTTSTTVFAEAQAAGLPIISALNPAANDVLEHGETALIVQPTSTALASALRQLSLRPALRHQLGGSARAAAKRQSIEHTTNQLIDTYRLAKKLLVHD